MRLLLLLPWRRGAPNEGGSEREREFAVTGRRWVGWHAVAAAADTAAAA